MILRVFTKLVGITIKEEKEIISEAHREALRIVLSNIFEGIPEAKSKIDYYQRALPVIVIHSLDERVRNTLVTSRNLEDLFDYVIKDGALLLEDVVTSEYGEEKNLLLPINHLLDMGLKIEDEQTLKELKALLDRVMENSSSAKRVALAIQILNQLGLLHTLRMEVHNAALLRIC